MPKQIPCIWMDGTAEEAARHYTSIFPNSSIGEITRYGPDMPPPMKEGDVLTVSFTLDGQEYTALNGGPQFPLSEAISFQIMCKDQEEADHYWNRLESTIQGLRFTTGNPKFCENFEICAEQARVYRELRPHKPRP